MGGLGNQLHTYAFARAYAERYGCQLQVDHWIGQDIFEISDPPITARGLPERTEFNVQPGEVDILFATYAQSQRAMNYTRSQAKKWFTLKPSIRETLQHHVPTPAHVWHIRRYNLGGFTDVSQASYEAASTAAGFDPKLFFIVSEETKHPCPDLPESVRDFLPDFFMLMNAKVLFRANSTFSWWAHVLADESQRVFAPLVHGLPSGICDCQFVEGNVPRCGDFAFTSDLHLIP